MSNKHLTSSNPSSCSLQHKTLQTFLNCLCWLVPVIFRRGYLAVYRRVRRLAVVWGRIALAVFKRVLCCWFYMGRSMCDKFASMLQLFGRFCQRQFNKLWKEITGRELAGTDSDGGYRRVSQFDEEAQIGHDRNSELIDARQQLRYKEEQLNDVEQQLCDLKQKLSVVTKHNSDALNMVEELKQQLKTSEQAKQEALSRLSEQVALKLADNNPNIADLSDMNRPTNLAEKFSTLYDDEWTEAFDALSKYQEFKDETNAIRFLLEIVQDCFNLCRQEAYNQLVHLLAAYHTTLETAPRELVKMNKDTRKKHASVYLPGVKQNVFKSSKYGNIIQNEAIQAYINRCTELCWLMSVQDPPMALYWDVAPDNKFDKAKYREYMKSGDYVDYIVWPCVLIQDDGNLMSKGVAQGRDHSKTQTLVTID